MNDLSHAIKSLFRTPGFTLIAIVTLGLGIGANTSMFSILNGYTLRPRPIPAAIGWTASIAPLPRIRAAVSRPPITSI
jgi:hypothetical protein